MRKRRQEPQSQRNSRRTWGEAHVRGCEDLGTPPSAENEKKRDRITGKFSRCGNYTNLSKELKTLTSADVQTEEVDSMRDEGLLGAKGVIKFGSLGTTLNYAKTDRYDVQHAVKETCIGNPCKELEDTQDSREVCDGNIASDVGDASTGQQRVEETRPPRIRLGKEELDGWKDDDHNPNAVGLQRGERNIILKRLGETKST